MKSNSDYMSVTRKRGIVYINSTRTLHHVVFNLDIEAKNKLNNGKRDVSLKVTVEAATASEHDDVTPVIGM